MNTPSKNSRRNWLKKSSLGAGAFILGAQLLPWDGQARQAYGMRPLNKPLLDEPFKIIEQGSGRELKARLLANENPYGMSPMAIKAVQDSAIKGNRYVYYDGFEFMEMLAQKEGVKFENIMISPGSTDILEKFAIASCLEGGNVISADPGYMSIVNTAKAIGAIWKNIPLKDDWSHDLKAMYNSIDDQTRFVYICNPNNPTGTITPVDEIKSFAKRASKKVPVFIDEAYLELMDGGESTVDLVSEGYDVVVCRTFSKIYGMAGLRMGYMVATPERVKMIQDMVRTEMGISVTSLNAAIASIQDEKFPAMTKRKNGETRAYVYAELEKQGFKPVKSHTSFILFPISMDTEAFAKAMLKKGVGIRVFTIQEQAYCRVSMGLKSEVDLFLQSLKEIHSS